MTNPKTAPIVGVLALQGDVREHRRIMESLGAQTVAVRRPTELETIDALVIPGGESTTIDKLLRAFELFEPLRERIKRGMPVYGSCAGMILLADRIEGAIEGQRTLGGIDMTVRRNAFGRQVDSFEADLAFPAVGGDEPVRAVFIRSPWVEEVGPDVRVLADVADGPAKGRIVAVQQGSLLATAFHPELTGDLRVHRLFMKIVKES
ncbi:MAG TPA: pyridoxal 5'-phosphate synthase glutaminase subunit PdxT [Jiangellaceae bacterium]|nr:pyridoxal 5'-phosphate synthase glutaminase subunit PdxT [Jiangellaceae bacterium]